MTKTKSVLVGMVAVAGMLALSAASFGQGSSGATLQASKVLNICTNPDGSWDYSGEIAVWNTGTADAAGLNITDCLQYKTATDKKDPRNVICLANVQGSETIIPGLTQEVNAVVFPYDFSTVYTTPLDPSGTIRNSAVLTIVNHSGGVVNGPNPKATWTGGTPPACVVTTCGCTDTQGYWGNKPDVVWPASGPQRTDLFFNSGLTYQGIMDASVSGGNAYINLAHQYIAAVLNGENGACEPDSVSQLIALSSGYFSAFAAGSSYCSSSATGCPLQVTWAAILADYNQGTGVYASNPGHCAE